MNDIRHARRPIDIKLTCNAGLDDSNINNDQKMFLKSGCKELLVTNNFCVLLEHKRLNGSPEFLEKWFELHLQIYRF